MEQEPQKKDISAELTALFEADQADRAGNWEDESVRQQALENDTARLARARDIYAENKAGTTTLSEDDCLKLAFIFQHSPETNDYQIAMELALRAGEKGAWLSAAAEDRYLLAIGQKQKWGTQFTRDEQGEVAQAPMQTDEESGVTDAMRAERKIPPRNEQFADFLRAEQNDTTE